MLNGTAIPGGGGGCFLKIYAPNGAVTLNGTIHLNGDTDWSPAGTYYGAGGGSGGTLFVQALSITGIGSIVADGWLGGNGAVTGYGGNGGGGGLIVFSCPFLTNITFTGYHSVGYGLGGSGYYSTSSGPDGIFNMTTY